MAEIFQFAASAPKRTRHRREAAGEIVIFPGIRVEYHDHPPTPDTKGRRPRGKHNPADGALSA
jgi:hypothetical protein